MRKRREEWEQDVNARQRNVVFPDTARNEGRFWRNLVSVKEKLTIVQAIGLALFLLIPASIFWSDAVRQFHFAAAGSTLDRLVPVVVDWAIKLGLFGVFFLILRWGVRRALLSERRRDRHR